MKKIVVTVFILFALCVPLVSVVHAVDAESEPTSREIFLDAIAQQWPGVFGRFRSARPADLVPSSGTTPGWQHFEYDPREGVRPSRVVLPTGAGQRRDVRSIMMSALSEYEQRNEQFGQFLSKLVSRRNKMSQQGYDVSNVDAAIKRVQDRQKTMSQELEAERTRFSAMKQTDAVKLIPAMERSRVGYYAKKFSAMHTEATDVVASMRSLIRTVPRVTTAPAEDSIYMRRRPTGTQLELQEHGIMMRNNPGNAETWPQNRLDNAEGL